MACKFEALLQAYEKQVAESTSANVHGQVGLPARHQVIPLEAASFRGRCML